MNPNSASTNEISRPSLNTVEFLTQVKVSKIIKKAMNKQKELNNLKTMVATLKS